MPPSGEDDAGVAQKRYPKAGADTSPRAQYFKIDPTNVEMGPPSIHNEDWVEKAFLQDEDGHSTGYSTHPLQRHRSIYPLIRKGQSSAPAEQGIVGSTWCLLNDIIGAPMITVPYFVAVCGWSLGLSLMWMAALPSFATLMLQHKLARLHGATSLEQLCAIAFGPSGNALASFSTFMYNYGGFIGGLLVIGDTVPHLVRSYAQEPVDTRAVRTWTLLGTAVCTAPFALRRDIAQLSFLGVLCFFSCMLLTMCLVFIAMHEAWKHSSPGDKDYKESQWPHHDNAPSISFLHALGGFTYLYTCQDVAFPIANSLHNNTTRRFAAVASLTLLVTLVLLTATVVSAAMLFGSQANVQHDNVLANFAPRCPPMHQPQPLACSHDAVETAIANICRAFIAFAVLATTPQSLYMPRQALSSAIESLFPLLPQHLPSFVPLHAGLTLVLLSVGLLVAILVTDLSGTFSFIGGVAGILITVCLPCASWLRLASKDAWSSHRMISWLCIAMLAIGVLSMGTSVIDMFFPGAIPDPDSDHPTGTIAGTGIHPLAPNVGSKSATQTGFSGAADRFRHAARGLNNASKYV